ncbi:MAG: ComF family protein [Chloroflexi bacterium]|nr:ComF family protein [Chloroflexota bacterium]
MPGIVQRLSFDQTETEARGHPGLFAPKRLVHTALAAILDLVFPPRCTGCGRVDTIWCDRCQRELELIPPPRHVQPLPPLSGMASTGVHDGKIQQAIWSLKYENARALAEPLGERLAAYFAGLTWPVDLIAPVPMHASRLAERGYNQAHLLAEQLAQQAGLPCAPEAVRRWRFTPSQVGLGRAERLENVRDAFEANPLLVQNRTVLLVDDVYTTGATLSTCAEALLQAGATAVYGLTVSVARQ